MVAAGECLQRHQPRVVGLEQRGLRVFGDRAGTGRAPDAFPSERRPVEPVVEEDRAARLAAVVDRQERGDAPVRCGQLRAFAGKRAARLAAAAEVDGQEARDRDRNGRQRPRERRRAGARMPRSAGPASTGRAAAARSASSGRSAAPSSRASPPAGAPRARRRRQPTSKRDQQDKPGVLDRGGTALHRRGAIRPRLGACGRGSRALRAGSGKTLARLAHEGDRLGEDDADRVADLHRLLVARPLQVRGG